MNMVYPGTRSTGCALCRKRKVKCDQRRPGCGRCELYGTLCPGYNRALEVRLCDGPQGKRLSSLLDQRKNEREPTPALASSAPFVAMTEPAGASREPSSQLDIRQLSLRPSDPMCDEESVMFFLKEFSIDALPGVYSGRLEFLPGLVITSPSSSPLRPATRASAYLALSRHYKSSALHEAARKYYGVALRSMGAVLAQEPKTWQDDTLAAIMLLHRFEDTDGEVFSNQMAHMRGVNGILKLRKETLLSKLPGYSLYPWAFAQLQIHAFLTKTTFECLTVPDPEPDTRDHPTGLTVWVAKIGRFWFSLSEILERSHDGVEAQLQQLELLHSSLTDAWCIHVQMGHWEQSLSPAWTPGVTVGDDGRILTIYSHQCLGIVWVLFYATCIIFYHGIIRCCRTLAAARSLRGNIQEESIGQFARLAESHLQQLTEQVCSSISYCLGEVDKAGQSIKNPHYKGIVCYELIWPLALVAESSYSTDTQARVCKETLKRIESMYGIKLAGTAQNYVTSLLSG